MLTGPVDSRRDERTVPSEVLGDTWREMSKKRTALEQPPKTVIMSPEEIAEVLSW